MHLVVETAARLRRCVQRVDHSTWRIYVLSNVPTKQYDIKHVHETNTWYAPYLICDFPIFIYEDGYLGRGGFR